ncbi:MAG: glycosyltransferase [Candidatus Lokiarchaeota archaeon]|nr:glycosyltransferase [Candidatus Lokiarchaeota archaeon]
MNICIVSSGTIRDSIPPMYGGGIQNYIYSISTFLASKGHNVKVFRRASTNFRIQNGNYNCLEIYGIKTIHNALFSTFLFSLKVIRKINKLVKKGEIEIIHVNSRVNATILRFFFPHIPFIFTEHNWDIIYAPIGYATSPLLYYSLLFFELFSLNFSSVIICLSRFLCSRIRSLINFEKKNTRLKQLPNTINEMLINESSPPLNDELSTEKYFLYIGRLEKEKNLSTLIKTFATTFSDTNKIKLYIIGTGSLNEYLTKLISDQGAIDRIFIKDKLSNKKKNSYLKNCLCLVLPSFYEVMPTVILEAYALRKPVIASNIAPHRELVRNKITGYLFNPNKEDNLAEMLNKMNDNNSNMMGMKAYKIFKKTYSVKNIGEKLVSIYKRTIYEK